MPNMGWIQKVGQLLQSTKTKVDVLQISELEAWVTRESQRTILGAGSIFNLDVYLKRLKEMRWLLACKIEEWQKLAARDLEESQCSDVVEIFDSSLHVLNLLPFPQDSTIAQILPLHKDFGKALDNIFRQLKNSSFMHNYSFISGGVVNPLYQELLNINSVWQEFEQGII